MSARYLVTLVVESPFEFETTDFELLAQCAADAAETPVIKCSSVRVRRVIPAAQTPDRTYTYVDGQIKPLNRTEAHENRH